MALIDQSPEAQTVTLLHPYVVCAEWCVTGPSSSSPPPDPSAVDLIRLGGGRLRFLVAKSDLEVSEKISASSC